MVSGGTGLSSMAGERPGAGDPVALLAAERRRGGRGGGFVCPPSWSEQVAPPVTQIPLLHVE